MARRTGEREKKMDRPAETLANGEQKQRRVPLFGAQNSALQGEILALSLSLEYEQYRAKVDQLENLCFQRNAPQGRRNELVFPVKRDEEIKEVCRGVASLNVAAAGTVSCFEVARGRAGHAVTGS